MTARPLSRRWYAREALVLAPELLNKLLVARDEAGRRRVGRIVEVEAYAGATDPASHAYRGSTARNATMFGPGGHLYVYFTYGMHWCANVVCGPSGTAQAVLIRALEPLAGLDEMRLARGQSATAGPGPAAQSRADRDLCRGPARLAQALAIVGTDDGVDLIRGRIRVLDDGFAPPAHPAQGPRVGISVAAERPWRFWVPDSGWVSASRRRVMPVDSVVATQ